MTTRIVDVQQLEWRAFAAAPGVRYKVLRHHADRRGITLLLHFDPGASYPAHRHPEEELIFVKEGTLEVTIEGKTEKAGPGSVIFYASNELHGMRNGGDVPATYYVLRWHSTKTAGDAAAYFALKTAVSSTIESASSSARVCLAATVKPWLNNLPAASCPPCRLCSTRGS